MAKAYSVLVGIILLVVGVVGFLRTELFGLQFHPAHNVIHLVTGLLGLWAGLGKSPNGARIFAQVFGVVYTLVAIAGFAGIRDLGSIKLGLNLNYNVIHLAVGLLGLLAGFTGAKTATA